MNATYRHWRRAIVRVTLCAVGFALTTVAVAKINEVTVFKAGEDGYHTYRIPAIVRAKNGDLLAFAEGRKNGPGDHGDIDIVLKRSTDAGVTWGPIRLVQDDWQAPNSKVWIGNPTPVVDLLDSAHPRRIWLVFTRSNREMFVISSDDNGETWSDPRNITATAGQKDWNWYAAGPVHAIQLTRGTHVGRLVIPCDHRDEEHNGWGVHLVYSDDHGATWHLGAKDTRTQQDSIHPNECVAVELADGRVYVNARDQNGLDPATRLVAYSRDGGETFERPFVGEPAIKSPVVQNSLVRMAASDQGGKQNLLVYCGAGDPKQRRDLTLLTSTDEAKTWGQKTVLHPGPSAYCDLVKLSDKKFGVLFEAGGKLYGEILFAAVSLDELTPRAKK